ncbi:MAG: ketoacyl-ACP synthase III [Bacteroidota bacterium]|nr:ketoacyl-ACP synthase III [Bacteroidota bacterium]
MALFSIPRIHISGIAACVPVHEEKNADYRWISRKEREQLIKTVGVVSKRIASKGTTTSDLCVAAAEKLIPQLGWAREDIQLIVFVSQARDYLIPATAGIIQDRLGLPKTTLAIDINLGCSGYIYGLSVIGSLMNTTGIRKGLLMAGDIGHVNASYRDKSSYPLFGDAGTVTALGLNENASEMYFNLQGDGSGYRAIMIPDGGFRNLINRSSFDYKKYDNGIYRHRLHVALDGIEVFNFSLREVVPNIKALLKNTNKELSSFDYVVFHQANRLINETLRKMLKLEPEKVPYSIQKYGNTSSASIPLTMVSELSEKLNKQKLSLLLSAFGIGLSWGSVILETSNVVCPEIIEFK